MIIQPLFATALSLCVPRVCQPVQMVFPGFSDVQPETSTTVEQLERYCTGFWTIYDDQATADNLRTVADAGPTSTSLFSTNMVLRADGQASRGSDFPGGVWSVVEEGGRWKLQMTLRNRRLKQERRYDGLLFSLAMEEAESMPREKALQAGLDNLMGKSPGGGDGTPNMRVIGNVTKWESSSPNGEGAVLKGKAGSFSMVKIAVDRTKLVPTIKPVSNSASICVSLPSLELPHYAHTCTIPAGTVLCISVRLSVGDF